MMKTYDYRLFMFIFAKIRSKTDKTMKRTLLSIASLALIFSVNSCSDFKFEFNEDYDLNNIKIDKFSGLQGIAAPIGSTTKFTFGDLLELDDADGIIKVDEDGYYYISMSDSELLNEEFKIDRFSLNGDGLEISQSFAIDKSMLNPDSSDDPTQLIIPETNLPVEVLPEYNLNIGSNLESNLDILDDIINNNDNIIDGLLDFSLDYPIDIQQNDIPEMVKGIKYADVQSDLHITLSFKSSDELKNDIFIDDHSEFDAISIKEGTELILPEWLVFGEITDDRIAYQESKIVFTQDVSLLINGVTLTLPVDKLDFDKIPEGQGLNEGTFTLNTSIKLNGQLYLKTNVAFIFDGFAVSSKLNLDPLYVESVCFSDLDLGDFADLSLSQEISFSEDIPEFFYGDNVVCDLADLRLKIFMKNGLPISGSINANIEKYSSGSDSPLCTYELPFNFTAESDVEQTYSEENVEGLNSILNPIPDYLRLNVSMDTDAQNGEPIVLHTDHPYAVQCGYEFIAPIAFGEDFRLSFTESITGLDVKGGAVFEEELELNAAKLKFNLVNTLPFNFELSAVAIDAEGNELTHLTVELEGEIKGGSVDSPAVNPMALNVTNYGPLEFDGIKLTFSATSATDYAALNKNQYIQLTDISLTLPQGVSYTLNEEN